MPGAICHFYKCDKCNKSFESILLISKSFKCRSPCTGDCKYQISFICNRPVRINVDPENQSVNVEYQ